MNVPKRSPVDDAPGQRLLFDAEVRCGRCGRRLRSTRALKLGFGAACFRRVCQEEREPEPEEPESLEPGGIEEAFRRLHDAGGDAWDGIDPEEYLRELREER